MIQFNKVTYDNIENQKWIRWMDAEFSVKKIPPR